MINSFRKSLLQFRKVGTLLSTKLRRNKSVYIMDPEDIPNEISLSQMKLSNLYAQHKSKKDAITKFISDASYPAVPDFELGLEWFNVSEPLSFKEHIRGKIVVLDFFTYCCINCMHILPDLKELEGEFSVEDGLVVVGVHSAKFANEKISSNILSAVQRYNITHPVVNDCNSYMWKNCEVQCWPTLLVLGPKANPLLMLMGEGNKNNLRTFVEHALQYYKAKGEISNHKIPFKSAFHLLPDLKGPLLFPGKITTHVTSNGEELLAVSDTGNHRILVLKNNGEILNEIGGKRCGFKDGKLDEADFNAPQGLVFRNDHLLYVADTENHAIRLVDLKAGMVSTVAGTGEQGNDYEGGNQGTFQEISSPWDLCIYKTKDLDASADKASPLKDVLIIAIAGTHQIWAIFLDDITWWKSKKYKSGTCVCIVGSGKEENKNNRYPHAAGFAQPSGLAISYKHNELYIADSESSSIRKVSLLDGSVLPVVGGDKNPVNLFAFGDKDGVLYNAKLQHALGVAIGKDEGTLLVADSYNHKIKKIDIGKNEITTLHLPKNRDAIDGPEVTFNEPGGLCQGLNGRLYIADTNNHSIRILHVRDDYTIKEVGNLELKMAPARRSIDKSLTKLSNKALAINSRGGKIILRLNLVFKDDLKLNEQAPQKWMIDLPNQLWSCVPNNGSNVEDVEIVLNVSPTSSDENAANIIFKTVTCTPHTCLPKNFVVVQPVSFENSGPLSIEQKIDIHIGPNILELN